MNVINIEQTPKRQATSALFAGAVTFQPLVSKSVSKDFNMLMVNFSKGARNKFHTHTSDQVLIVTSGKGIVATEDKQQVVGVGDVIHVPAGEKHWHGATKESDFSHIALEGAGSKITQIEQ